MYAEVLSNKKVVFYDPQTGGKAFTYDDALLKYQLDRSYYMKPNN